MLGPPEDVIGLFEISVLFVCLFVCVCFSLGVWFTLCYFVYDTKHALCTEFADLFKRCLLLVLLEDFACMIFSLVFKILKKCLRK